MKRVYKLGDFKIIHLNLGTFKLDGGAMFGVVPKVLWSKSTKSDRRNRITLGLNPLLVIGKDFTLLIDNGIGNKYSEKEIDIYGIKLKDDPLKIYGIKKEDITHVILTHLHFDHAGGSTEYLNGDLKATYPNAIYFVQKKEFEDAMNPNERTRASYRRENFEPLYRENKLILLEGDSEILKGIKVIHTGGHTEGHQFVIIESENEKAIYFGDIVPTSYHIPLPYIMGYDTHPLVTLEIRKKYYALASKERWLCFFEHDPIPKAGIIKEIEKGKYSFEEIKS
ncbi:MAG: MBL fold metallo-hydrolase [Candidatus Hydrothermales bacterium]